MRWVAFLITMNLYILFKSIIIYILKVMPNSAELKCAYNTIGYINSLLFQNCRKKNASFTDIFSFGNAVTCLQLKCSNFVQLISSEIPIFVLTQGCIS